MDTLDGIANWWIDEPGGVDRRRLLKALERLVDLGVLAKVRTAGQQFFRLAAPLAALVERGIIEAGMGGELLTYRLASRPTTEDGSDMDDRTPTAE